jgi:ABC-type proline/glycine betaine transport system substrate-binding protein
MNLAARTALRLVVVLLAALPPLSAAAAEALPAARPDITFGDAGWSDTLPGREGSYYF